MIIITSMEQLSDQSNDHNMELLYDHNNQHGAAV